MATSTTRKYEPSSATLQELIALFNSGQWSLLETRALDVAARFPGHPFGWKILGTMLGATGRFAGAVDALSRATSLSPSDAMAHSNLGNALAGLGRLNEAEASYRRAFAADANYAEAHNNLGNVLKDLGRLDEAESSYRRAIALRPTSRRPTATLGMY